MQRLCYSEAMEWEIGAKENLKGSLRTTYFGFENSIKLLLQKNLNKNTYFFSNCMNSLKWKKKISKLSMSDIIVGRIILYS